MTNASITIQPRRPAGTVQVPYSKSHVHRLLIADFLAGGIHYRTWPQEGADIQATCRCLASLADSPESETPCLDCGESGSTLRFLLPLATALRPRTRFTASGRLPNRPIRPFLDILAQHGIASNGVFPLELNGRLSAGEYAVPGDVSSQIVTGLLFTLPLLGEESAIRCTTPLQSRGYVDMTLQVIRAHGICIEEMGKDTWRISANQQYNMPADFAPELDWSGAAFWLTMNALGAHIQVPGLSPDSAQPDRAITRLLSQMGTAIDVSQCPDIFPVLTIAAAAFDGDTTFTGVKRLRLKESDRIDAMAEVLQRLGVESNATEDSFTVFGHGPHLRGNIEIHPRNDHRIAMAAAVASVVADGPITIFQPECTAKSYPDFFRQLQSLSRIPGTPHPVAVS